MQDKTEITDTLSPWWRRTAVLIILLGFTVLIWIADKSYTDAPPIPGKVMGPSGELLFTREDILSGQQVFLRYGLMENGTIWGHGAYLGPDFSAEYLHTLVLDAGEIVSNQRYKRALGDLSGVERSAVIGEVQQTLKQNRYDPGTGTLYFTPPESASYQKQITKWAAYFSHPAQNAGLPAKYIKDSNELQQLTAFFAWTAWASVANRPDKPYSYTNNFPFDPMAGNTPTSDAVFWSALSLIALLAGIAAVLFAFGKFNFLGWKGKGGHVHPQMLPGITTESQRATIKYFVIVVVLFLAQVLVGAATAHYRADPASFYGLNLSQFLPSHILCTWHLQLALFWITTAFVAGGLFLAPSLGGSEPRGQAKGVNLLFGALLLVAGGSLLGEFLSLDQLLGRLWFWFGHQGWEFLDLGRAWQIMLVAGLVVTPLNRSVIHSFSL